MSSEISTENTTRRDNDGMKMTAAESSANKDAENIHTDLVMGLHERTDSGSWIETPEIRRLTMSDVSRRFLHFDIKHNYASFAFLK